MKNSIQMLNIIFCTLTVLLSGQVILANAIKVEIIHKDGAYQLYRDGKPYQIKGAGLATNNVESLAGHGGNSFRNWSTIYSKTPIQQLLDKAQLNNVTVSLCLDMARERDGFDYDDEALVAAQLDRIRVEVLKYRDHPALLTWIIGNELNHHYKNPKVYDAVNDVSKMIHELDPNHPTTTTLAELPLKALNDIETRAPDLDFVSFQVYGQLHALPDFIKKTGYKKPFMVTEWGTIGYWEMENTSWGAPVELTSTEKAKNHLFNYNNKLKVMDKQLIGSYVFLWGQKQERTSTWFGLFTESGDETETVDVMHFIWNGSWPKNRTPVLKSMTLNNQTSRQSVMIKAGEQYRAVVDAFDHENDRLSYNWYVKPSSTSNKVGGDFEEKIMKLDSLIENTDTKEIKITAPSQAGAYRLFVYVYDGNGHAAHANIPFYVND